MEGCDFAVEGFECSRTGSARDIDGLSYGYTYRLSGTDRVAIVNTADYAVLFIPRTVADEFGIEDEGSSQVQEIKTYLAALDETPHGGEPAGEPRGMEGAHCRCGRH